MAAPRRSRDHLRIFRLTERPGCASLDVVAYVLPEAITVRGGARYPVSGEALGREESSLATVEPSRQFVGFSRLPDRKIKNCVKEPDELLKNKPLKIRQNARCR